MPIAINIIDSNQLPRLECLNKVLLELLINFQRNFAMYILLPPKKQETPVQKKIKDIVSKNEWEEIGLMDVVVVDGILTQENDNKELSQQES